MQKEEEKEARVDDNPLDTHLLKKRNKQTKNTSHPFSFSFFF